MNDVGSRDGVVLSIVIPFYNEAKTLGELVRRVLGVDLPGVRKQVVLVDDGSRDGSSQIAAALARGHSDVIRLVAHPVNRGKGAALRSGFRHAEGNLILIQDADLEYDPADIRQIVDAFSQPGVDAVFGSRLLQKNPRGHAQFYWGGRAVTAFTNVLYGSQLTDQPTCYKAFRRELLDRLDLQCDGFEICAEIAAKLLRSGCRIVEVPISYNPRHRAAGKKLRPRHGLSIAWTLARLRFSANRSAATNGELSGR